MVFKYTEAIRIVPTEIIIKEEKVCDRITASEAIGGSSEILGIGRKELLLWHM